MIHHVMADGTKRDSIKGRIIPKEISESILFIFSKRKETNDGYSNKTGTVREKQVLGQ